jgi:diadenosine tetraphosphate (Ap4A) HIT family hydrolase
MDQSACELCDQSDYEVVHRTEKFRVVLVDDAQYPGFCRVIWNGHVKEMTDLPAGERALLMTAVWQVEAAVREAMNPDKMNVVSLGNMVPHLHWHVIPRYSGDAHYPGPIWATKLRDPAPESLAARSARLPALRSAIERQFKQAS